MAKIEGYLKMNADQLEEAIAGERRKIRKAKTEIALLEKLKIASQASRGHGDYQKNGNEDPAQSGDHHQQ